MATVKKKEEEKDVVDKELRFEIRFSWVEPAPGYVNFEGYEITGFCGEIEIPEDIEYEDKPMFKGFIKWDNCMEIHEFNHHWCKHDNMAQRIVDMIYQQSEKIMTKSWMKY